MLVDFTYYQTVFEGNAITEQYFNHFSKKAERFVNYATANKVKNICEVSAIGAIKNCICEPSAIEAIKNCICELAEYYQILEKADNQIFSEEQKVISSETVGSWSASYDTSAQKQKLERTSEAERKKKLYSIVKEHLFATGLLFRGVI